MCKHIAATLYAVGARLDSQPELLFRLRNVDPAQLIQQAVNLSVAKVVAPHVGQSQDLAGADLSALFGIDLGASASTPVTPVPPSTPKAAAVAKKTAAPKVVRKKTLTASELTARGVPAHIRQKWLKTGMLLATEQRGVYQTTPQTAATITAYLRLAAR